MDTPPDETPPDDRCPKYVDFISFYSKDRETPETKTHLFSILSNDVLNGIINEEKLQIRVQKNSRSFLGKFLLKKVDGKISISIYKKNSTNIGEKNVNRFLFDNTPNITPEIITEIFQDFKNYLVFLIVNNQELLDYLSVDNLDKYIFFTLEFRNHVSNNAIFGVWHVDSKVGNNFSYTCLTYLESQTTTEMGLLTESLNNEPTQIIDFLKPVNKTEQPNESKKPCQSVRFDASINPNTTLWFNNQKIIHRVPTNVGRSYYQHFLQRKDIFLQQIDITPIVNVLGPRIILKNDSKRRTLLFRCSDCVLNGVNNDYQEVILHTIQPDELVTNKPYKIQVYNDKIDEYFNNHIYTDDNGKTVLQIGKFFVAGKQGKTKTRRRRKAGTRKKTKKRNKQTP